MQDNLTVLNVMEDGRIAGPQLRMLRVANALAGRVNTIIAIPECEPADFRNALEDSTVPYIQLPLTKLSRRPIDILLSIIKTPMEVIALRNAAVAHSVDVIHSSGGAWMFKAIIAARLAGKPSVWHLNDTSSPGVFRWLARLLLKRWAAGVIVAGSRVKRHYLPDYDDVYAKSLSLKLIEAPVDTSAFIPLEKNSSEQVLKVMTVGNVNPIKGYETVLLAANEHVESPDYQWDVVGSSFASQSKYRQTLDSLQAELNVDNVSFVGPSSNVASDLARADIYVCTSIAEASPTAVWEAMACGLPVVATDVGSISDHIQHGVNGFLAPVGGYKEIANYISILSADKQLRLDMGNKNRMIAVEHLDLKVCAQRHFEIYSAVSGNRATIC